MNIVVFDLPAVVSYDRKSIRQLLLASVNEAYRLDIGYHEVDWSANCSGIVLELYKNAYGKFPGIAEYESAQEGFKQKLREYYLSGEELFEVRSGIQNLFYQLDKREDWNYYVISDFWHKDTLFLLNSCGVHSKNINLYTADDALSMEDVFSKIANKVSYKKPISLYQATVETKITIPSAKNVILKAFPLQKQLSANYFEYPKFNDIFKKQNTVLK